MTSVSLEKDFFGPSVKRSGDRTGKGRTEPLEILVLGLCRTGTLSMAEALQRLGHRTYHMQNVIANPPDITAWLKALDAKYSGGQPWTVKEWDDLLGEASAILDVPAAVFAEELMATYPDAKVILTARNVDSWHKSCSNTVFAIGLYPSIRVLKHLDPAFLGPWVKLLDKIWEGFCGSDMGNGVKQAYTEHCERVRRLAPKERFLEFDVAKDDWTKLATFLDKPIPSGDFPNINDTKSFGNKRNVIIFGAAKRAAWRFVTLVGIIGVSAIALQGISKRLA